MNKFRFRKFKIYRDARNFIKELKEIIKKQFPKEEQFSLTSQLFRALDSIVLHLAEGADRGTDKDFAHYLNGSHTSLNEVVACLDIALDQKYITDNQQKIFLQQAEGLANQLTAFRNKLLKEPNEVKVKC